MSIVSSGFLARRSTRTLVAALAIAAAASTTTACEDAPSILRPGGGSATEPATSGTDPEAAPESTGGLPANDVPVSSDPRSAGSCARCHGAIFSQWSGSMHARAAIHAPVVAQTNQVARGPLAAASKPDPANMCVNCHAPTGAAVVPSAVLPIQGSPLGHEGITCVTCHGWNGAPEAGSGGLVSFQSKFSPANQMFGTIANPVQASAHGSAAWVDMKDANDLCASCHDVHIDRNADGKIVKGTDLVLQTTAREYKKYRDEGGTETCVSCHMPGLGNGRAANSARIPEDQATEAPARALHDHGFAGVDAPLDATDRQKAAREKLLRSAARLTIDDSAAFGGTVEVGLALTNTGAGHNLPTGFVFARQMWVELVVRRANGELVDSSGLLAAPSDDLCDASTYENESAMRPYFAGCNAADPRLVSFQQKLVDRIDVVRDGAGQVVLDGLGDPRLQQHASGVEAFLQHLPGGAVPRVRPFDNQPLGVITPGETRRFTYTMRGLIAQGEQVTITARLLFRQLPPYFLRALAAGQKPGELPSVIDLPKQLQVTEMARVTATARRQ